MRHLTRRAFVRESAIGAAAVAGGALALGASPGPVADAYTGTTADARSDGRSDAAADANVDAAAEAHGGHMVQSTVGDVGPDAIGIDPTRFLETFDTGTVSTLPDGRTLREWDILAFDKQIEVAPGVFFPAWTYNGQVPGPTLRCTEGDLLRIRFKNAGTHPHTIHFHGFHPPSMDGFAPVVEQGGTFTYEFTARPFGLHPYHCHAVPLKKHLHKGLYGALIIDPPGGRPPAREMVMVMNGFDTNFDGANEIYAVNSVAFHYQRHPIRVRRGDPLRVYLVNLTEFDPINSFHLHAGMFKLFKTGTRLDFHEFTDIVMLCQGERAVLDFTLDDPGMYMFHAHQSELAELGWMGFFESVDEAVWDAEAGAGAVVAGNEVGATIAGSTFATAAERTAFCNVGGAS
ncbi:MAG: multicopper oxidase domain-containing protein [Ardenticatenales bacterium]|nr:multicopper oxidase domain-containing protein [Ardenticatenales bacterium]